MFRCFYVTVHVLTSMFRLATYFRYFLDFATIFPGTPAFVRYFGDLSRYSDGFLGAVRILPHLLRYTSDLLKCFGAVFRYTCVCSDIPGFGHSF